MFWSGLFISVASVPGYTSAAFPAGWAALSMVLPLIAWRNGKVSLAHVVLFGFLAFVALSALWATSPLSSVWRLWQLVIFGGAVWLGSTLEDPKQFIAGLAAGGAVSSLLAFGQWMGVESVLRLNATAYAGLHFNGHFAGMIAAMLIVACLCYRLWWFIPAVAPGLILSNSRGAVLATAFGTVCIFIRRPILVLLACVAVFTFIAWSSSGSDAERRLILFVTWHNLSWLGNGAGSFADLYIVAAGKLLHPEHVHNDYLHLIFEFGVGAIAFGGVLAYALANTRSCLWPILATFTLLAVFTFPLFTPIPALLAGLAFGRGLVNGNSLCDRGYVPVQGDHWMRWGLPIPLSPSEQVK